MRTFNKVTAQQLSKIYRNQLKEIMEEWARHTQDKDYGGFHTNFDEDWNITSCNKNIWAQARQTYMFAAMYHHIEKDPRWLDLAKIGRDFLVDWAYEGGGRWNYELDYSGKRVIEGTKTVFTDLFVLSALAEYAVASGDLGDLPLIDETFTTAVKNILDPNFKDIHPHKWIEGVKRQSIYMIAINAVGVAGQVLGREIVTPFIKKCTDELLDFFGDNPSGFFLESLKEDGSVWDTEEGRVVIPGHIFEGMWFCIDEAQVDQDGTVLPRALKIIDKAYKKAIDKTNGGIIYRYDCFNKAPSNTTLKDTGALRADDKVDWVHCEGLYTLGLVAVLTNDNKRFKDFLKLHDYCQKHFRPQRGGDWYPLLAANGEILRKNKGGKHRAAFHVPRALMNLTLLFQKA